MLMWSGSGKRLGEVANGMTLADGTSSITILRAALHRALRREAERRGRARLLELIDGDRGPMRAILDAATAMTVHPVHEMPPVPRWHRGRLVLVGDAAHATSPTSGQGASMAFEDAVVLAACLRDPSSPIERALEAYVERRRARVERVARWSARVGSTKVLGPVGRWLRDLLMPLALPRFASANAHRWLYGPPLEHGDATCVPAPASQTRLSP